MSELEDNQPDRKSRFSDIDLVHTAPSTIMGRYLRLFWQPVYRAEDLPAGEAKPARIMGEDFTLYRGETGTPHAVGFRCAHRAAQMSVGFVEGDCIRCFYHGWKFDADGKCIEQPAEKHTASNIRIRSYPTQEYLGLIFVYLGDGEAPPLPRFPSMEQDGLLDTTVDTLPTNFLYSLENDVTHSPFVHRDLMLSRNMTGVPEVWAEESDWGVTSYARWPGKPNLHIAQRGMPNVGYIVPTAILLAKGHKYALHVSWRVPVDDESHATFRVNLLVCSLEEAYKIKQSRDESYYDRSQINKIGDAVLAGKLRLKDIKDRTHIEFIQDYIAQVGQGSSANREFERLGQGDATVIAYRKILYRELSLLMEDKPLKQWRLTNAIEPAPALS